MRDSGNSPKRARPVFRIIRTRIPVDINANEFAQLSSSERYTHFQNQAYIIKQLKRKLRTEEKIPEKEIRRLFEQAEEVLKGIDVELTDQKDLIKNLIIAIKDKKLEPGSYQFERISTIVRNLQEDNKEDEPLFGRKQQAEFGSLLKIESINNILRGQPADKEVAQEDIMKQYILMQTDFLSKMTYHEFINVLRVIQAPDY